MGRRSDDLAGRRSPVAGRVSARGPRNVDIVRSRVGSSPSPVTPRTIRRCCRDVRCEWGRRLRPSNSDDDAVDHRYDPGPNRRPSTSTNPMTSSRVPSGNAMPSSPTTDSPSGSSTTTRSAAAIASASSSAVSRRTVNAPTASTTTTAAAESRDAEWLLDRPATASWRTPPRATPSPGHPRPRRRSCPRAKTIDPHQRTPVWLRRRRQRPRPDPSVHRVRSRLVGRVVHEVAPSVLSTPSAARSAAIAGAYVPRPRLSRCRALQRSRQARGRRTSAVR